MALTGLHTTWSNGSYANDRNYFLKKKENQRLANGESYGLTAYYDGSIAIGYGDDLLVGDNALFIPMRMYLRYENITKYERRAV